MSRMDQHAFFFFKNYQEIQKTIIQMILIIFLVMN